MPEPVVLTENLTRRFGDFVAVDHVNFSVMRGRDRRLPGSQRLGQDHHHPHAARAAGTD